MPGGDKSPQPKQLINPVVRRYDRPEIGSDVDVLAKVCDPRYPFLATTYRVTEHWQTGLMTRWQPWLAEMQPSNFVEMSEELADMKEIDNGDQVKVSSARGEIMAVAIVTKRFKPFKTRRKYGDPSGRTSVALRVENHRRGAEQRPLRYPNPRSTPSATRPICSPRLSGIPTPQFPRARPSWLTLKR